MEFENGVTPQDEPRQGRLNLEKDYFVYVLTNAITLLVA